MIRPCLFLVTCFMFTYFISPLHSFDFPFNNQGSCHLENPEVVRVTHDLLRTIISDTVRPAMELEHEQGKGLSPDLLVEKKDPYGTYGKGTYFLRNSESFCTYGIVWTVDSDPTAKDVCQAAEAYLPQADRLCDSNFAEGPLKDKRFLSARVWIKPEYRRKGVAYGVVFGYVDYLNNNLGKEPWMRGASAKKHKKRDYHGSVTYVEMENLEGLRLCATLNLKNVYPYIIPHRPDNAETVIGFYLLTEKTGKIYPDDVWNKMQPALGEGVILLHKAAGTSLKFTIPEEDLEEDS